MSAVDPTEGGARPPRRKHTDPFRADASEPGPPDPDPLGEVLGRVERAARARQRARAEAVRAGLRVDRLPAFRLVLHHRDADAIEPTVETLVAHTPLDLGRAVDVVIDARNRARAPIMEAHLERAEFYRERLRAEGLGVTLEPAD